MINKHQRKRQFIAGSAALSAWQTQRLITSLEFLMVQPDYIQYVVAFQIKSNMSRCLYLPMWNRRRCLSCCYKKASPYSSWEVYFQ